MTEAVVNELELVDILPKLLNRDLFSERKMKEMNEEERTIFKKIDMEAKLDEFNIHEWLEDVIFDGEIYFDNFNNFIYYNDDDFYKQIVNYYEQNNLFGIDLILFKRQMDIFKKIDNKLEFFYNRVLNILEDPSSLDGDEWYFLKNITKMYNEIKKYKAKIETTMLYSNLRRLNRLYHINEIEFSIEMDYTEGVINGIKRKMQMLLNNEKQLLEIKNWKMDEITESTVTNLLKENKTIEEIAEITNYPKDHIEMKKESLEMEE